MPQKTAELPFEQSLEKLESLIKSMETGDIALAELINKFEEGSILLKQCQANLAAAELRIEQLNLKTGQTEPTSLNIES